MVGAAGNLGEVSNDEYLMMIGYLTQLLTDTMTDLTADPGIDLIKYQ